MHSFFGGCNSVSLILLIPCIRCCTHYLEGPFDIQEDKYFRSTTKPFLVGDTFEISFDILVKSRPFDCTYCNMISLGTICPLFYLFNFPSISADKYLLGASIIYNGIHYRYLTPIQEDTILLDFKWHRITFITSPNHGILKIDNHTYSDGHFWNHSDSFSNCSKPSYKDISTVWAY